GGDTYPDSRTNGAGPSFVEILDFSAPGPEMTAVVRRATGDAAEPVDEASFSILEATGTSLRLTHRSHLKRCAAAQEPFVAIALEAPVSFELTAVVADDSGFVRGFFQVPLADARLACSDDFVIAALMGTEEFLVGKLDPRSGEVTLASTGVDPRQRVIIAPPIVTPEGIFLVVSSDVETSIVNVPANAGAPSVVTLQDPSSIATYAGEGRIALGGLGRIRLVEMTGSVVTEWNVSAAGLSDPERLMFGSDRQGLLGVAVGAEGAMALLAEDGTLTRVEPGISLGQDALWDSDTVPDPLVWDVDEDGLLDVVMAPPGRVVALTRGGALVGGFPLDYPSIGAGRLFLGEADDGGPVLYVAADEEYVYAYRPGVTRRVVPGYPLPAGTAVALSEDRIYTVSGSGNFRAWQLRAPLTPRWSESYGDPGNTAFVETDEPGSAEPVGSLLIPGETYSWPNPVRDGLTNFRFATTEDASVTITIVDMAGGEVDRIEVPLIREGAPFEVAWSADVQSGLYLARVTATSASGTSESRLVKLAVIR
ncbi:MAG: hypothetical protein R3178_05435, partial [Rhodothermales bacterium]|nr:hypothetical protein [Rhodothermales bacterium]